MLSLLPSYPHRRNKLWRWCPIISSARFHLLHPILEHILERNPGFQNTCISKIIFGLLLGFSDITCACASHAFAHSRIMVFALRGLWKPNAFIVIDLGAMKTDGKFVPVSHSMKTYEWLEVGSRCTHLYTWYWMEMSNLLHASASLSQREPQVLTG
jgi:hypothetical protein